MDQFLALGIILLFALLAGHLVKVARIPEVTGYIVAGVIVGPSVLGWLNHDTLGAMRVFSEVALGLILLSIGSVFEWSRFAQFGRVALRVVAVESALTFSVVAALMLVAGQPWTVALLLGVIATETAAATTMMVLRECNCAGPLSDTLTSAIACNNLICLTAFMLASAAINIVAAVGSGAPDWPAIYGSLFPLFWQTLGSASLGFLIGMLLAGWASHVREQGETLILLAGCVLLCVGFSHLLQLSPLVSTLSVGATMVNLSAQSRRLFEALSHTDPPLYAIFFVIAGADLNLAMLPSVGVLGLLYVAGRSVGKLAGAGLGGRVAGAGDSTRKLLGWTMLSQAGLAIGLVLAVTQRFPALAPTVNTVVLASVAVFEMIGPLSARIALGRSGEVRDQQPLQESIL